MSGGDVILQPDFAAELLFVIIPGINDALTDVLSFGALPDRHHVKKAELLLFDEAGQKKYETFHIPDSLKEANSASQVNMDEYKNILESFGLQVCIFRSQP